MVGPGPIKKKKCLRAGRQPQGNTLPGCGDRPEPASCLRILPARRLAGSGQRRRQRLRPRGKTENSKGSPSPPSDTSKHPAPTPRDRVEIGQAVSRHSAANGLDPMLVMAVIVVESGGNPGAVSPKGATGLMQVMPWHVDDFGGNADLTDIDDNIRIGTFILADNMRRWGHNEGIQRYFWGSGQPDGRYLAKVMKAMEDLNG